MGRSARLRSHAGIRNGKRNRPSKDGDKTDGSDCDLIHNDGGTIELPTKSTDINWNDQSLPWSRRRLFGQVVMLAQLDDDRLGHDLAAVNLRWLASIDRGVPSHLGIGMNCHLEIARADSLLHDFFEFGRCFLLLVHAGFLRGSFGSDGIVG